MWRLGLDIGGTKIEALAMARKRGGDASTPRATTKQCLRRFQVVGQFEIRSY
ncbi:MAG: hypothetical protein SGJ17_14045 [Hyphomicrobiales bacterium]|nr:hypothetical protein [Hyphomicrobiales bacterium]